MNTQTNKNIKRILETQFNSDTKSLSLQLLSELEKVWGPENISIFCDIEEEQIDICQFIEGKNKSCISVWTANKES